MVVINMFYQKLENSIHTTHYLGNMLYVNTFYIPYNTETILN